MPISLLGPEILYQGSEDVEECGGAQVSPPILPTYFAVLTDKAPLFGKGCYGLLK
jgi:hypothetical protein